MAPTRSGLQLLPLLSILFTGSSSLPSNSRYANSPLTSRDAPAFSPLGCFTDNEHGVRALADSQTASDDMTVEKCAAFCSRYNLFGIEYGRECYCGNTKAGDNNEVAASECSFPCAGNPDQTCGAGNRLNIYSNANPVVPGPATGLVGITSLGCFVDGDPRVLPYDIVSADDMTALKCALHCAAYDYFGTQWSRECYCGTAAPTHAAPASECSMACSGNPDELCGAGQRLNVYKFDDDDDDDECEEEPSPSSTTTVQPPSATTPASSIPTIEGFDYQGCYTDNVPHRVLSGSIFSDPHMTPSKCAASCTAQGYTWFGTEYGVECYCGHELNPASTKVPNSECSSVCGGDPSSHCGAGDRLSIYATQGVPVPVPAGNLPTVGAFRYSSCWADDVGHRVLNAVDYRSDGMTIEICASRCEDFAYFGLQYGRECYCGNELSGGRAVPESECGMLCLGKTNQLCGGPSRLNLYTRGAAASSSAVGSSSSIAPALSSPAASSSSYIAPASSSPAASSSSIAPASSSPVASISSSASPASSASITTPTPSSSAAPSATPVPSSSSVPSSTISSSTSLPPASTTITNCPSSSTVGPEQCYVAGQHPAYCNTLTAANLQSRGLSSMLVNCQRSVTANGNPSATATSCFPTGFPATFANNEVAKETGSSVLSCLRSATCTFASDCKTSTYPATAEIPSPTPSIGVNLLKNPSFELTDVPAGSFWNFYQATSPNFPQEISTTRARTGTRSYKAKYMNINGQAQRLNQVIKGLEPLRRYQARVWYSHTNTNSAMTFVLQANPGGFTTPTQGLSTKAANTWHELVLEFTAVTSWIELNIEHPSQVVGNTGTPGGMDDIYVDDVWFSRLE